MPKNSTRDTLKVFKPIVKRKEKNMGSIISIVGKTTVEIIELFECTQKSHKNYNEKRPNHH
ncbi:hypothetical protein D3846_10320 [Streptococcus mutans]|nr:hypothetical protein [Streptococcus mutans]NLQ79274.1 hypothetical protein [Streptococcus mutans]NLQ96435.1 hypothetical protein [Streptococcus mutans]